MTSEAISPDLKTVLRRLKLSRMLDTLPERFILARQQKMPFQDFLLLVLADEGSRRDGLAATLRAQRARLDPAMQLETWEKVNGAWKLSAVREKDILYLRRDGKSP